MSKKALAAAVVALPILVSGLAYAAVQATDADQQATADAYVCPLTGEDLPCPNCCPLKQE